MTARVWTCQRRSGGVKCGQANARRFRLCQKCGKRRPDTKRPDHMSALDLPYEYYVALNGGETCGVCGRGPTPGRKLDRDHLHEGVGIPRGLLCHVHNRALKMFNDDLTLMRAAVSYIERSEARRPR